VTGCQAYNKHMDAARSVTLRILLSSNLVLYILVFDIVQGQFLGKNIPVFLSFEFSFSRRPATLESL
jgi:hypothetical protein